MGTNGFGKIQDQNDLNTIESMDVNGINNEVERSKYSMTGKARKGIAIPQKQPL